MNENKELDLDYYFQKALVDAMNMYINMGLKPMGFLKDEKEFKKKGSAGGNLCEKKYEIADMIAERYKSAIQNSVLRDCQPQDQPNPHTSGPVV